MYRTCVPAAAAIAALALAGIAGCASAQSGEAAAPASSASASTACASPRPTPTTAPAPAGPRPTPTTALPSAAVTPARTPSASRSLLTQADSGLEVTLPVGAEVTVVLTPPPTGAMWDQPVSGGCNVVLMSATGGYPSSLPARAVFRAVTPGSVNLTAQTDYKCNHQTPPCPAGGQEWQVTVLVPADT